MNHQHFQNINKKIYLDTFFLEAQIPLQEYWTPKRNNDEEHIDYVGKSHRSGYIGRRI
jgi:hypothetical protein